jgi:hypothetical protein
VQLKFKNVWGTANSNVDPLRSDLFLVDLKFPAILNTGGTAPGNVGLWESECQFAVRDFPFPNAAVETIPVKYLQQTNHTVGADAPTAPIDMQVRWAFQRRTAELLTRWSWLIHNPITGGVAITSQVKSRGRFSYLVPNMAVQSNPDNTDGTNVMLKGPQYTLEGVFPVNVKPTNSDMAQAGLVELTFSLSVDRYYPKTPDALTFQLAPGLI